MVFHRLSDWTSPHKARRAPNRAHPPQDCLDQLNEIAIFCR
ncbi:hypothetical protein IMCC12053_934 [Celeribacter marinus]|uniref:Uncharacterized protein n=1 Tax=Celeribacter marinus TaxID=1397108 RepID=A0A0P0AAF4_9RHOB|nr:hypothetical protein IMCC12053_934 [Celeribacter marinus]